MKHPGGVGNPPEGAHLCGRPEALNVGEGHAVDLARARVDPPYAMVAFGSFVTAGYDGDAFALPLSFGLHRAGEGAAQGVGLDDLEAGFKGRHG